MILKLSSHNIDSCDLSKLSISAGQHLRRFVFALFQRRERLLHILYGRGKGPLCLLRINRSGYQGFDNHNTFDVSMRIVLNSGKWKLRNHGLLLKVAL